MSEQHYNFGFLNEETKRMVRRTILKAVAVPGYQVPFASREIPVFYGFGTGGVQVTASVVGPGDTLKVIDVGSDDTMNAVSIRKFFSKVASIKVTEHYEEATIIQTRHRIPEMPLKENQILVVQVATAEPLAVLEPRETETRKMHAYKEYGLMHMKLFQEISRFGRITTTFEYPVLVNDRYLMNPSTIPKFDNPKLDMMPCLQIYGAGREKRIYAIPPYTKVTSLDFEDYPFDIFRKGRVCELCGHANTFLDEVQHEASNRTVFICSDRDYCNYTAAKKPSSSKDSTNLTNSTSLEESVTTPRTTEVDQ